MKKAVLINVLLLSFMIFHSSQIQGREINQNYTANEFPVALQLNVPGDTNAYLYLDPTSNTIFLSITLNDPAKVSIVVLDILGTVVWTLPETSYDSGKQMLSGGLNLGYGQYIVKVLKNGYVYKTQKILVIK